MKNQVKDFFDEIINSGETAQQQQAQGETAHQQQVQGETAHQQQVQGLIVICFSSKLN